MTRSLSAQFLELSCFLRNNRALWSTHPFAEHSLAWEQEEPELSQFLRSWSAEELERFELYPEQHPEAPELLTFLATEGKRLTELSFFTAQELSEEATQSWFIRQRKWQQVKQFSSVISPLLGKGVVDWCGGKGHLGRNLALWNKLPVEVLELQPQLCVEAEQLAAERSVELKATPTDLLKENPELQKEWCLVALHACGELSEQALRSATQQGLSALSVSPCCYHRHIEEKRKAMSLLGQEQDLELTYFELLLPSLKEQYTSELNMQRRRREMAYRSGLDLLLRAYTGVDTYRSFRSVPTSWKDMSFREFVMALKQREGFSLPDVWKEEEWEARGWRQARTARALGSVRGLFRRAIELWVVLDRALWLQEQGWSVEVGCWCDPQLTPRNILLRGWA